MTLKIAFIMDPIQNIAIKKDTTFALMLEAQRRGWDIYYLQPRDLWLEKNIPWGKMARIKVQDKTEKYYALDEPVAKPLTELDRVFIRKDPPFDMDYIYMTYLLEHAHNQGVSVINNPRSIRDCNEKLFATWFPQCCPDLLVSTNKEQLRDFAAKHSVIVIKPLGGMGGRSIFRLEKNDPNLNVAIETLTDGGRQLVMAQQFIPEIMHGDKRVLMINGEPIEYALARIPAKNDFRGNLAAGASSEGRKLTERDRWIAAEVGPVLREKGLVFVGLDIIGDYLTEINVTSPTCLRELDKYFNLNIAAQLFDSF